VKGVTVKMTIVEAALGGTILLYILFILILDGKFEGIYVNKIIKTIIMDIVLFLDIVLCIREQEKLIGLAVVIVFVLYLWRTIRYAFAILVNKSKHNTRHDMDA
jgi:hypothetical protein